MTKIFNTFAQALATAALAATVSMPVAAAPVTYEIVSGMLGGQSYGGSFTFDDASTPGVSFDGFPLYELLSFSFTYDGVTYSPDLATLASSGFGWAVPTDGSDSGLELAFGAFSFLPGAGGPATSGGFAASLAFDGTSGFEIVDVAYRLDAPTRVPEPSSLVLALIALLGMGTIRRGSACCRTILEGEHSGDAVNRFLTDRQPVGESVRGVMRPI